MFKGLKHLSYEEKLRDMTLFSLGHLRDSSSIYMNTRRMGAENGARLFSVVPGNRYQRQ